MFFGSVKSCEEILPGGSTYPYKNILISPDIIGEAHDEFHEEVLPALRDLGEEEIRTVGDLALDDQAEVA